MRQALTHEATEARHGEAPGAVVLLVSLLSTLCFLLSTSACAQEVRLYTSVDEPVARKVINAFEKQSGIRVLMTTDAESTKTIGLVERLRAEKANPRCDIWWNNEIFHTVRLANEGVLKPYDSPTAGDIPARFVDAQKRWTASGFRIRVIVAGRNARGKIAGMQDLLKPELNGRIAFAKPAFGTAGGHVAALYAVMGQDAYLNYIRGLKANGVKLLGGNAVVADFIGDGRLLAGPTDNDDGATLLDRGDPVQIVVPDQQENGMGTLAIPCTLSMVAGADNPPAQKLFDFLVSPAAEKILIEEKYAYASVRTPATQLKLMNVEFAKIAEVMPKAVNLAIRELE